MADPDFDQLGVTAQEVSRVEDEVLEKAEARAAEAESEELGNNLKALDGQLKKFRNEERVLARASFTKQRSRALQTLRKKIETIQRRKNEMLEADVARKEIRQKSKSSGAAISDDKRGADETEREFLIRTGKLTPFQGKVGYSTVQGEVNSPRRKRIARDVPDESSAIKEQVGTPLQRSDDNIFESNKKVPSSSDSKTRSTRGKRNKNEQDDDYRPSDVTSESSAEDLWEPASDRRRKRRRVRRPEKFEDSNDEDLSASDGGSEGQSDLAIQEGDDWKLEDEEEVEVDGGLRIPASVYDKLFDYQKTGVS